VKPRQRRKNEAFNKDESISADAMTVESSGDDLVLQESASECQLALSRTSTYRRRHQSIHWNSSEFLSVDQTHEPFHSFDPESSFHLEDGKQFYFQGLDVLPNSSYSPSLAFIAPASNPSPLGDFYVPAFGEFSKDFHQRLLINHFCNTLSHLIVLGEDEGNPFQQLVLPLAYNSPAVKGAIYALASAHLEDKGVKKLDDDEKSIQFHSEAIRGLAKLIDKGDNADRNELLATIILLVYYEVVSPIQLPFPPGCARRTDRRAACSKTTVKSR
jgi:hypothetical protein